MRVTVARETSVPVMLTVPTCRWLVVRHVRSMAFPAYATPSSARQSRRDRIIHTRHKVFMSSTPLTRLYQGTQVDQWPSNLAAARARWRAR